MSGNNMRRWLSAVAIVAAAMAGCDDGGESGTDDAGAGGAGAAGGAGGQGGVGAAGGAGGEGGMGGMGAAGGEGGMGGMGGAGGEGGMGGAVGECQGVDLIDMNADGTEDAGVFSVNGSTGEFDNFAGSCTTDDGGDAVVKFVAPSAGIWLFSTEASGEGVDTVMYALSDCNDGFSELACNDDGQGGNFSEVAFELEAGGTTYLVVDAFAGFDPLSFTLTAQAVAATAPTLDSVDAFVNADSGVLGLRVAGMDPEDDVVSFDLALLDGDGMEMAAQTFALDDGFDFTQAGGAFQGDIVIGLPAEFLTFATVNLSFNDRFGLKSEVVSSVPMAPSADLVRGDACDLAGAFAICPADDACVDETPDDEEDDGVCVVATAPSITGGEVFLNAEGGLVGIRVTGMDPEDNAAGLTVLPMAGEAELPLIDGGGAATVAFTDTEADAGAFTGSAIVNFVNFCLPAAQANFEACAGGGGEEQMCVDQANAMLDMCNAERIGMVTSVVVVGLDETGKESEPVVLEMVSPAPDLVDGDTCDVAGAFGNCPEETFCYNIGAEDADPICQAPAIMCPEAWGVVNMNEQGDGPWSYMGDSTEAANLSGAASCGGGGAQAVHSFTAPAAGTYVAEITMASHAANPMATDTLIFTRTHCALPQEEFQLECNDDIEQGNLLSSLAITLEADETAYVFVDGYTGQGGAGEFAGTYTLVITAQ